MAQLTTNFYLFVFVLITRQLLSLLHLFMFMKKMWKILMYTRLTCVILTILSEVALGLLLGIDSSIATNLMSIVAFFEFITALSFIGFDYSGDSCDD